MHCIEMTYSVSSDELPELPQSKYRERFMGLALPNPAISRSVIPLLAIAACLFASLTAGAASAEQQLSREQLLQRIEKLEAKAARADTLESRVTILEAERHESWLSERRAQEVRQLIREVLTDAESRAALLNESFRAGHNGKHFFLAGPDGRFTMEIGGQLQLRYIANWRDGDVNDDLEGGFQIRRAKVFFEGTVINPRLHYAVQLAVSRDKQTVSPDKLVLGYDLTDDLYLWGGEDKGPFLREELISSKKQLAVDRSLVNEAFTLDKVQGIGVKWNATDSLRVQAMLHDGMRSGEAPGDDWIGDEWAGFRESDTKDFQDDAVDYALAGRVDWLLAGSWKNWKDFSSQPDQPLFAYIGAAIDYEQGETGDASDNHNWLSWTVDGGVEVNGLSLYVAYVGAATDFQDTPGNPANYQPWGLVAQASYNMAMSGGGSIEPFVRFEHLDVDGLGGALSAGQKAQVNLLTLGTNWYLTGHRSKFTVDLIIALDPLHDMIPGVSDGIGLLHDASDQDRQIVLRLQYQLLF